jgi:hypothetical protein
MAPQGYIVIDEVGTVPICFVPERLQDTYPVMYADQVILSRSEPWRAYGSGGPRIVSFDLIFIAVSDVQREVIDNVRMIRAGMYPRYGGAVLPPPLATVVFGTWFRIRGIIKDAQITWGNPWQNPSGGSIIGPMRADVRVTIEEVSPRPRQMGEVAGAFPRHV